MEMAVGQSLIDGEHIVSSAIIVNILWQRPADTAIVHCHKSFMDAEEHALIFMDAL